MSIQNLFQQILQSGKGLAQDAGTALSKQSSSTQNPLGGFGGGALMGGALGLLLGNKKFRKMGGKLAGYGGAAAVGALALKTYQDWQSRQASPQPGATANAAPAAATPLRLTNVETPLMEQHSRAMLSAMIAAAKADGHIGPEEKAMIEAEVQRLAVNEADQRWLHAELEKPADPAAVAAMAQSPEMATEIYLASLLVTEQDSFMERAYLDELARSLRLDPSLKAELEAQALQVTQ
ncbi:tellurite resistance TerB family protein [Achromobacter sp. F4_2707]|uniref:tellurite resistance TerB family protein n=1 Tax=Achromobacter sp. F4_2707 TaxID=3114286 RepID=UPI0039C6C089